MSASCSWNDREGGVCNGGLAYGANYELHTLMTHSDWQRLATNRTDAAVRHRSFSILAIEH